MANELVGLKELTRKLNALDAATRVKALRSVLFKATTPVVTAMKGKIPIADRAARTYKGRLVSPGFAQRSIKRLTGKKFLSSGKLSIAIGVKAEAWYAINLIDQGPYTITERRNAGGTVAVKPYTLSKQPWFQSTFIAEESRMLASIKTNMKQQLEKIAKNG